MQTKYKTAGFTDFCTCHQGDQRVYKTPRVNLTVRLNGLVLVCLFFIQEKTTICLYSLRSFLFGDSLTVFDVTVCFFI